MAADVNIQVVLKGLRKAQSQLGAFSSSLNKVAGKARAAGTVLSATFTAPIIAIGVKSTAAFLSFEKGMNRVKAVSGATAVEFDILRKQAKKLGEETSFSASEAAAGMGFLAQAGFEVTEIISSMPRVLELAAAAQLDLGTSADIVSNIMKGFGLSTEDLAGANDTLVAAMTNANVNLSQLGEAMKFAGPIARAAGVSFGETAALIAKMGDAGIQGSLAGTALKNAIAKLLAPSKNARAIFDKLGITVVDISGKLKPMGQIIESLGPIANDAGALIEIFGQRAGPAMAGLIAGGGQAIDDFTEKITNMAGITKKIQDEQLSGFVGQWERLKSTIEGAAISIGETMAPVLGELADSLRNAASWFTNLDDETKKLFVGRAAILAIGGPALLALAALIQAFDAIVISLLKISFAALTNPLILIPALIAAVVAALASLGLAIGETLSGESDSIGDALQKQFNSLSESIKELTFGIIDFGTEGEKSFTNLERQAKKAIVVAKEMAKREIELTSSKFDLLADKTKQHFISIAAANKKHAKFLRSQSEIARQIFFEKNRIEIFETSLKFDEILAETKRHTDLITVEGKKLLDSVFNSIRAEVDEKARSLFEVQEFRRQHAKAIGNIEEEKGRKILRDAQKEFDGRLTLQKTMVSGVQVASEVIRKAIGGQVQSSSDVWKDFFSSVVDILAQMAIQAITKAAIIGAQMAIATAGISLVIGLLASVFGGRKKKDTQIRDAVDNFLKEVKRSLDGFENDVLSTLQRVNRNTARAGVLSNLLQRRLKAINKIQTLSETAIGRKGNIALRFFFDQTTDFFKELTLLGSNTANPNEKLRDAIKEQILLLTKNSQETLDLINAEFDLKKANINEILNLLQRQKDFIKGIDRSITDVTREFFTPDQLFSAQKSDIDSLRQSLIGSSGEEKLTILADLKAALLASFETAKTIFAPSNQQTIQKLRQESVALTANASRTSADQLKLNSINKQIAVLAGKDAQSESLLVNWQENVIVGLEAVRTAGSSTFDSLIDLQLKELQISQSSLVTEQNMRTLLSGIANASALSIKLLGQIAKSPATTTAATVSELATALSVIFPENNPTLANLLSTAQSLPGGIPQFGSGGFVNKPTLAVVGERGPEVIARIDKNASSLNTQGAGGVTIQNIFQGPLINDEISLIKWTRKLQSTLSKEQKRFV